MNDLAVVAADPADLAYGLINDVIHDDGFIGRIHAEMVVHGHKWRGCPVTPHDIGCTFDELLIAVHDSMKSKPGRMFYSVGRGGLHIDVVIWPEVRAASPEVRIYYTAPDCRKVRT